MEFYKLKIDVKMKRCIDFKHSLDEISKLINAAMYLDKDMQILHTKTNFKYYTFSNLYPATINEDYQANKVYSFNLHTLNREFFFKIRGKLFEVNNDMFEVIGVQVSVIKQTYINAIETVTPAIAVMGKVDNHIKHWNMSEHGFPIIKSRILSNTKNKYEKFYDKKLPDDFDFIRSLQLHRDKPSVYYYKGAKMLCHKFTLHIKEDFISQEMAFLILGSGLLEKTSIGFGHCRAI